MSTTLLNALPAQSWEFGAYKSSLRGTPILLVADVVNGVGETRYSALRKPGAAAGYQVTAGKTLRFTYVRFNATAASARWLILSGTADAGDSQVAAPAGAQSENSRADGVAAALDVLNANNPIELPLFLSVATGRFPAIRCMTASLTLCVFCIAHEE